MVNYTTMCSCIIAIAATNLKILLFSQSRLRYYCQYPGANSPSVGWTCLTSPLNHCLWLSNSFISIVPSLLHSFSKYDSLVVPASGGSQAFEGVFFFRCDTSGSVSDSFGDIYRIYRAFELVLSDVCVCQSSEAKGVSLKWVRLVSDAYYFYATESKAANWWV